MSKHFELLNYSEHGTVVDNIVYCCDVGEELSKTDTAEDSKERKSSFLGSDDLFRRNWEKMSGSSFESKEVTNLTWITRCTTLTARLTFSLPRKVSRCGCRTEICSIGSAGTNGTKGGWEGTALLTHGSHVKFGCMQFILCISNTNEKPRFIHH